jgi:hypothetical protein
MNKGSKLKYKYHHNHNFKVSTLKKHKDDFLTFLTEEQYSELLEKTQNNKRITQSKLVGGLKYQYHNKHHFKIATLHKYKEDFLKFLTEEQYKQLLDKSVNKRIEQPNRVKKPTNIIYIENYVKKTLHNTYSITIKNLVKYKDIYLRFISKEQYDDELLKQRCKLIEKVNTTTKLYKNLIRTLFAFTPIEFIQQNISHEKYDKIVKWKVKHLDNKADS